MQSIHALLLLSALVAFEDSSTPAKVVEWLAEAKKHAAILAEIVAAKPGESSARVVMVGRAFNGTADLSRFEGSIAACASADDAIAIDIGFREGEELDRWLRSGVGDIDKLLLACGSFGWSAADARTWFTELRKRSEKPKIVGIATGDPVPASTEVLAYLGKMNPEAVVRAGHALRSLTLPGRNGEPRYMQLSDNERAVLRMGLEETLGLFRDSEDAFTQKSSAVEFARHLRLLVELQQYEEKMRFEHDGGEHDPRGKAMAENAVSELKNRPKNGRVFAFVGLRDLARASDPDSFAAQFVTLGGGRAVCIGTACGAAEFLAIDPNGASNHAAREVKTELADASSLERAIANTAGDAPWIVDLRTKPTDASVVDWLTKQRTLRSAKDVLGAVSETPWDHDVLADFDAIAWFPKVARSR